jgi:hypothetical protein
MRRRPLSLLVFGAVLAAPAALGAPAETASPKHEKAHVHEARFKIPESMRLEHEEAREERSPGVEKLAQKLQLHARSEEELFYPAALVVGDVARGRE